VTDFYSRLFVVDVVDNICNLFYGFVTFHFQFPILDHYTLVIWVTKNLPCIKMVIFLILSEIRARVYILTGGSSA
jgi:hypothetical protein